MIGCYARPKYVVLPVSFDWDFLFLLVTFKNSSTRSSLAQVLLSGSGSKQRSMKAFASADMDSGISGCILNIPTWQMQKGKKKHN